MVSIISENPWSSLIDNLRDYRFPRVPDTRSVSELISALKSRSDDGHLVRPYTGVRASTRELGIEMHEYIASALTSYRRDTIGFFSGKRLHMYQFDRFWQRVRKQFIPVWVEKQVVSSHYCVAGRVDVLLFNRISRQCHIVDWKFGVYDVWGRYDLKPPFTDLRDNVVDLGALQIAIYRLIIERELEVEIGEGYVVHILDDSFIVRRMIDMRSRVDHWLIGGRDNGC